MLKVASILLLPGVVIFQHDPIARYSIPDVVTVIFELSIELSPKSTKYNDKLESSTFCDSFITLNNGDKTFFISDHAFVIAECEVILRIKSMKNTLKYITRIIN